MVTKSSPLFFLDFLFNLAVSKSHPIKLLSLPRHLTATNQAGQKPSLLHPRHFFKTACSRGRGNTVSSTDKVSRGRSNTVTDKRNPSPSACTSSQAPMIGHYITAERKGKPRFPSLRTNLALLNTQPWGGFSISCNLFTVTTLGSPSPFI